MANTKKIGFVAWDQVEQPKRNFDSAYDNILKFEKGENTIRILTRPAAKYVHQGIKFDPNEVGYGSRVDCSADDSCPACLMGDVAKKKYIFGVIDRKSQSYKLIEISSFLADQIKKFVNNEHYGPVERYDIVITKDPTAPPAGHYSPLPLPPKELSAADLEIRKNIDLDQIKNLCTPPTNAKVQERLDKARAKKQEQSKQKPGPVVKQTKPEVQVSQEDLQALDESMEFPSVN